MKKKPLLCPCESAQPLAACCGLYHRGAPAPDAERLMRSRYSAYALGDEAYLLATWHSSTRPTALNLASDSRLKWVGLSVLSFEEDDDTAWVSFVARFKEQGRAGKLEEKSRFVREGGRWFYVEGTVSHR